MKTKNILLTSIIAGVAIVAFGFLMLCIGTSGPCAPVDLTAKVGYTLVGLPTIPVVVFGSTVGGIDTIGPVLENAWVLAAFDAFAYAALVFVSIITIRIIRRAKTKGQHAVAE